MNNARTHTKKGFTLVELLVSLGIFSIAVVLTAGSYLIIVGLNQRAQAFASLANNTAFVLENMTRLIRTGTDYACGTGGDCASGGTAFTFTDPQGRQVTYGRVAPVDGVTSGYIQGTVVTGGNTVISTLTDPAVNITALKFYVTGTGTGNTQQPFVRMVVSGTADAGHGQTFSFDIQTAATMRGIDI